MVKEQDPSLNGGVIGVVTDNSTNGTFVNDTRVGKGKSANFSNGDQISLTNPQTGTSNQGHIIYKVVCPPVTTPGIHLPSPARKSQHNQFSDDFPVTATSISSIPEEQQVVSNSAKREAAPLAPPAKRLAGHVSEAAVPPSQSGSVSGAAPVVGGLNIGQQIEQQIATRIQEETTKFNQQLVEEQKRHAIALDSERATVSNLEKQVQELTKQLKEKTTINDELKVKSATAVEDARIAKERLQKFEEEQTKFDQREIELLQERTKLEKLEKSLAELTAERNRLQDDVENSKTTAAADGMRARQLRDRNEELTKLREDADRSAGQMKCDIVFYFAV